MQISQQADAKEESEKIQSKKAKSLVQETKDDEDQRWEDLQLVVCCVFVEISGKMYV